MEKQIGDIAEGDRQTAGCACDDRRSLPPRERPPSPTRLSHPAAGLGMRPHAIATDNYFKTGRTPPGRKRPVRLRGAGRHGCGAVQPGYGAAPERRDGGAPPLQLQRAPGSTTAICSPWAPGHPGHRGASTVLKRPVLPRSAQGEQIPHLHQLSDHAECGRPQPHPHHRRPPAPPDRGGTPAPGL